MKFIIGYKQNMAQRYRPDGRVVPVTIIKVAPCVVTKVNTSKDGYEAVQLGSGERRRLPKPLAGSLKELGKFRTLREFRARRGQTLPVMEVGNKLDLSQFVAGDFVNVVGTSKGRGFQGVVKRHGFHGSPKTHGHKDQLRMPGSIGATAPQRVFKGKRMAGHMGASRVTVKGLEVIDVNTESNELSLKGAVPGAPRSLVLIQSS
jgi:large subunit ribosomal protein L3